MSNKSPAFRHINQASTIGKVVANERSIEELKRHIVRLSQETKNLNDGLVNAQFTIATLRRCLRRGWWRKLLFGIWDKRWLKTLKVVIQETKEAVKKEREKAKQQLKEKEVQRGNTEREAKQDVPSGERGN